MNPEWARSLRDQCVGADVPFLFKQWGNWTPISLELLNGHSSKTVSANDGARILLAQLGKKRSGRTLDGRTWDDIPVVVRA
jgi:protein gp37